MRPGFRPITAIVSQNKRPNGHTLLSRCKTLAHDQGIQAHLVAPGASGDDALVILCAVASIAEHRPT